MGLAKVFASWLFGLRRSTYRIIQWFLRVASAQSPSESHTEPLCAGCGPACDSPQPGAGSAVVADRFMPALVCRCGVAV